jgi:hypothetical protein
MLVLVLAGWFALGAVPSSQASALHTPLESGFLLLYNLDFAGAHRVFLAYEKGHVGDPLGPACEAAGLLFSEFNRLGVLESQFYDDQSFAARKRLDPDPKVRQQFNSAITAAEKDAEARLENHASDADALFALTLSSGLQADYSALIDKSNLASLRFTRVAAGWAQRLLVVDPTCYDAHLATGFSRYIVGSMAAPLRWIVRMGGISGDKKAGISELQLTAQHGHYLAPFARILLAIAYVREKDKPRARETLTGLRAEFPANLLFAREIGRLDAKP